MNMIIAHHAGLSLQLLKVNGMGPTGYVHLDQPVPYVSSWSTVPNESVSVGVRLLNEDAANKVSHVLSRGLLAANLQVDDAVVLAENDSAFSSGELTEIFANAFDEEGFVVPAHERKQPAPDQKAVGCILQQSPAKLGPPAKKRFPFARAFQQVANEKYIDVEILKALIGVYLFGALLRRPFMSILHSTFRFMEVYENRVIKIWPSLKQELVCLGRSIPSMEYHAGKPFGEIMMATDARGGDGIDNGAYGIAMSHITKQEVSIMLEAGEECALGLARKNDALAGLLDLGPFRNPDSRCPLPHQRAVATR